MPKGLALPVGIQPTGGARLVEGSANDSKIVLLALGDTENENAFQQDIGLGASLVFEIADAGTRPRAIARIREIFDRFQQQLRYELVEGSLRWLDSRTEGIQEGETVLELKYFSKEANEERILQVPFAGAQQGTGTAGTTTGR